MSSKYETEPSLESENNSHTMIVGLVGESKAVLDVGAATGYVARLLTGRGCRVTGVEVDPEAARQAEAHCERVVTGDIETLDLRRELGGSLFDVIVFGDVLEHLRDPLAVLKRFRPFLAPGGYVVASIPNVAHGSVRLALLQGRFQYQSLGLLDDTHLRFFTRETIEQMFDEAGFAITELKRTRKGVFGTEVEVDRELVPQGVLKALQESPEFRTYQFVLKACPTELSGDGEEIEISYATPPERPSDKDRMIYEQQRKLRNLEHLRSLSEMHTEQLAEKEREVTELTQEVTRLNRQLARLKQPKGGGSS